MKWMVGVYGGGVEMAEGAGVGQLLIHVAVGGEQAPVPYHPARRALAVHKYHCHTRDTDVGPALTFV